MDDPLIAQSSSKNDGGKLMKILVPIFTAIFIVILILIKRQNADFPLRYVILIGALILVIGSIVFFGANIVDIFKKNDNKEKDKKILPEPAETKVLWEKAKMALVNPVYRDHIKEYLATVNHSVGKNVKSLVVEFKVRSLYRPRQICSILINANYPDRLPTVLFEPTIYDLNKSVQSMSFDPEDPADTEETVLHNELTGTTAITKRKSYHKKLIKPTSEKKEALV